MATDPRSGAREPRWCQEVSAHGPHDWSESGRDFRCGGTEGSAACVASYDLCGDVLRCKLAADHPGDRHFADVIVNGVECETGWRGGDDGAFASYLPGSLNEEMSLESRRTLLTWLVWKRDGGSWREWSTRGLCGLT